MKTISMHTPWGPSQTVEEIAPGITHITTASHGGYRLSSDRLAEMPEPIRGIGPWAGPGWYEEDCDWALVAVSFPQHFDFRTLFYAVKTIRMTDYHAPALAWLTGTDAGRSVLASHDVYEMLEAAPQS